MMTELKIDLDRYIDKNIADLKIGVLKELAKIKIHYEVHSRGEWKTWTIKPFEKTVGSERNEGIIKKVEIENT